ncbi:MAG: hypothetical protein K2Y56_08095 [Methylobacterium sp.]|uniref:hypothetical protein n=1 Tax=Methylobacterium sp. TaxID=409 RepID=UPI0025FF3E88|nr:hypothetical protein [Methylobacterium sp.]MBX9931486.1 hypothetical protein [Methylobacterium sp.]
MNLTPLLQRLGVVLIGLALAMGPIVGARDVTVVLLTGVLLLASSWATDLVLIGRGRLNPARLRRAAH